MVTLGAESGKVIIQVARMACAGRTPPPPAARSSATLEERGFDGAAHGQWDDRSLLSNGGQEGTLWWLQTRLTVVWVETTAILV